jgi:hypothetical protein
MKGILKKEEIILRIGKNKKSILINKKKYINKKLTWNPILTEICKNTIYLYDLTPSELEEYIESRKDMFSNE